MKSVILALAMDEILANLDLMKRISTAGYISMIEKLYLCARYISMKKKLLDL